MPLLNRSGIQDGNIVFSLHVKQLVDAFTFAASYDILVSGGLYIGTNTSGSDNVRILGNLNIITDLTASNISASGISASSLILSNNISASNLNISNWNTAFGWGNHALKGYLTASPYTTNSNWNVAFNNNITGASFSGVNTKTLSLFERSGAIITASFTDISGSVTSSYTIVGQDGYLAKLSGSTVIITSSWFDNNNIGIGVGASLNGLDTSGSFDTRGAIFNKACNIYYADADYTLNDNDSIIILASQLTTTRNFMFSSSLLTYLGREITIINQNANPQTAWKIISRTRHDFFKPDISRFNTFPTGSLTLLCYSTFTGVFSWMVKKYISIIDPLPPISPSVWITSKLLSFGNGVASGYVYSDNGSTNLEVPVTVNIVVTERPFGGSHFFTNIIIPAGGSSAYWSFSGFDPNSTSADVMVVGISPTAGINQIYKF